MVDNLASLISLNYKNMIKNNFCVTFGSVLIYNKLLKVKNLCVCGIEILTFYINLRVISKHALGLFKSNGIQKHTFKILLRLAFLVVFSNLFI